MSQVVLFVCPHGAGKSRMAAAFFDLAAPPGWQATSAGIEPGPELSPTAARLLAGTDAEAHLDSAAPRTISAVANANRVVGIDCVPEGATNRWDLSQCEFNVAMRDEIRALAEALASELGDSRGD
jgi:protein-tyrosine-phosphatase